MQRRLRVIVAKTFFAASLSNAQSISIDNGSFQSPATYTHGADTASSAVERWTIVTPPSWTLVRNGASGYFPCGVADPANPQYSNTSGGFSIAGTLPGDGHATAYGYLNAARAGVSELRYAGSSLGTFKPRRAYTLTVAIGERKDLKAPRYAIELFDGESIVASSEGYATRDTFRPLVARYYGRSNGGVIGIRIVATNDSADSLRQANFDNVRLGVTSCDPDINFDQVVDDSDFQLFVLAYDLIDCDDPEMGSSCPADLNNDGFVDDSDFIVFVAAYNELLCP